MIVQSPNHAFIHPRFPVVYIIFGDIDLVLKSYSIKAFIHKHSLLLAVPDILPILTKRWPAIPQEKLHNSGKSSVKQENGYQIV